MGNTLDYDEFLSLIRNRIREIKSEVEKEKEEGHQEEKEE